MVGKLGWIKRQRVQAKPRQTQRLMVSGESHYFLGLRNRLRVIEEGGAPRLAFIGKTSLDLFVRPGTGLEKKQVILHAFYRAELIKLIPDLLEQVAADPRVTASAWGINGNQLGHVQHQGPAHLAERRARDETCAVPGVHPGAQAHASARTSQ